MVNNDDDDDLPPIPHIVTSTEMLMEGLRLLFEEKVIDRRSSKSKIKNFIDNFGMKPTTALFCATNYHRKEIMRGKYFRF